VKKSVYRFLVLADITGRDETYHVGDEAMAEVALDRLEKAIGKDNIVVACGDPEGVAEAYGVKTVRFHDGTWAARRRRYLRRPLSIVRDAMVILRLLTLDGIFVSGGGNLTSVWPHVLESRIFLFRWARRLRKRLILASQTLGPFSERHALACRNALRHAEWIGVRDPEYSASQIGLPVRFAVDDAVFLPARHDPQTRRVSDAEGSLVGVSLRHFKGIGFEDLRGLVAALLDIARRRGDTLVFIPHHAPHGRGDLDLGRQMAAMADSPASVVIVDPVPRATAVNALTGGCEWVVTMRYHQLIFALAAGVPSIGVHVDEYTRAKLNGAFEQFGLPPRLVSHMVEPGQLELLIEDALRNRGEFEAAATEIREKALEANLGPYRCLED